MCSGLIDHSIVLKSGEGLNFGGFFPLLIMLVQSESTSDTVMWQWQRISHFIIKLMKELLDWREQNYPDRPSFSLLCFCPQPFCSMPATTYLKKRHHKHHDGISGTLIVLILILAHWQTLIAKQQQKTTDSLIHWPDLGGGNLRITAGSCCSHYKFVLNHKPRHGNSVFWSGIVQN